MRLAFDALLADYRKEAGDLLARYRSADPKALDLFRQKHPRFLDDKIPWLSKNESDEAILGAKLQMEDAQLAVARRYDFRDWGALADYADSLRDPDVYRFESAVEAVISGDITILRHLLDKDPDLVHARSKRITHFDPAVHRATLLHYVAANGVEGYRQKTPSNAVAICRTLLERGAEPDSLCSLYGTECTIMSLLVSSCHPANAGVQVALVDTLIDFGAAVEGADSRKWGTPILGALVFGYPKAADALRRRGAKVDLLAAAGLGLFDKFQELLPSSDEETRQRALILAAMHGHAKVVEALLKAGVDPDRYNPENFHAHTTPIHQAALAGHLNVVRTLVEHGARTDQKDTIYQSTPLGWAHHGGKTAVVDYLTAIASTSSK